MTLQEISSLGRWLSKLLDSAANALNCRGMDGAKSSARMSGELRTRNANRCSVGGHQATKIREEPRIADEFFDHWSRLCGRQQESNLRDVLEKVVFDLETETLTVTLSRAGMIALIGHPKVDSPS